MLTAISKALDYTTDDELGKLSFAERILYWTIVLTPLWWLLGIQTLLYPAIAVWLLVRSFRLDKLLNIPIPACIWAWLGMAIAMIWTATLGLVDVNFDTLRLLSTIVTFFKGYFLIVSCLVLPFWNPIRSKVLTRAIAWMAVGYGITVILQFIILFLGVWDQPFSPPLAKLIPGDKLSLLVKPATFQPFFGIPLPRTSLYMADPPIPGVCGLLCFFICAGESNRRLRYLAIAGSLLALLVSQSRLAWVCFPIVVWISLSFRNRTARHSSLWVTSAVFMSCAFIGVTLVDVIHQSLDVFTGARAESSADRSLVVSETLKAWQNRPWLGWGIAQGEVTWYVYKIVLGSFSTYAGVLYLHGIFGFTCLITALGTTLWNFWNIAMRGNKLAQGAFASFLALCLLIEGLPLSWMCIYFWFYFIWLGVILFEHQLKHPPISKWQKLI